VRTHASVPSEVEPASIADLVADCLAFQALLGEPSADVVLPVPRRVTIPDRALAVVADLDSYGG
jgi:hypothetical protein